MPPDAPTTGSSPPPPASERASAPPPSLPRALQLDETRALALILELGARIRATDDLQAMLRLVTDAVAALLGVNRVSLRLLDETRSRLLVAARTGPPLHGGPDLEFESGEGLAGWIVRHRESLRLDEPAHDPRYVRKPGMRDVIGSFLGVPLLDREGCIGVLSATARETRAFDALDELRVATVASVAGPHVQAARLGQLARMDPLTSAFNRRALDDVLPARAEERAPLCVLVADLDSFKDVNDRYGHAAGDEILRAAVRALASAVRRDDRVIRMGGDEFLIVLPEVDLANATRIAERAREQVAAIGAPDGPRITVSIGVAERRKDEARESVLSRADDALYAAKDAGRNRVVVG